MQDRPEDLALEAAEAVDLVRARGEEAAVPGGFLVEAAGVDRQREAVEPAGMRLQHLPCRFVDHRPDVGVQIGRVADAQFLHGASEQFAHPVGDVGLDEQHAQRRAALAGGVESRGDDVANDLFRQRRGIGDQRVLTAGLGDQRQQRAVLRGERAGDQPCHLGRAGEGNAGALAAGDQSRTDASVAGQEGERSGGDAGTVQQFDRQRRHQRRLLRRLGDDAVACGERRRDLADEDGEGEVPRADADEDATAMQRQAVALAGRARQMDRLGEFLLRLCSVVAAEVDRLAHLGDGVGLRASAFAHEQRDEFGQAPLHQVGGAQQRRRARACRRRLPGRERRLRCRQRLADVVHAGLDDQPDEVAVVGRRGYRTAGAGARAAGDQRRRDVADARAVFDRVPQVIKGRLVVHVQSFAVGALGAEEVARQGNPRLALACQGGGLLDRVGNQRVDRQIGVGDAIDERRVGAVFEQSANQVREQVLMAADRRVDAAGASPSVVADDLVVEFLAHAVQALILPLVAAAGADRQFGDGRQGVGVVRRKRRVERLRIGEQAARTGEVREVARNLAREHRVVDEPALLRQLDLGVPIGSLAQAHHQPPPAAVGEVGEPVEQRQGAFLVGLDGQPEAVPAGQFGVQRQRLDEVERDLETIGFLGVDREADVARPGAHREFLDCRQEFVAHPLLVRHLVTRVQCRQLDRDRWRLEGRAASGGVADGGDRVAVRFEVAQGVGAAARRLAQHVVGMAVTGLLGVVRALDRFVDVAPHDELAAEDAHGGDHRLPDDRFAGARDQPLQRAAEIAVLVVEIDDAAGQHQRPGASVDEGAVRGAESLFPFGVADLVADQSIDGRRVGNPQQRLGETHEDDALARREVVGGEEGVDAAGLETTVAYRLHQRCRPRVDSPLLGAAAAGERDEFIDDPRFVDAVVFAQPLAQGLGVGFAHAAVQ
ncbi:MAG: hypothetical protein FAZ92_01836 [Accumulibacter sp.]|nr:MAG: hypothetical protein FAZ92_01836 [Accumulibacter sp.]